MRICALSSSSTVVLKLLGFFEWEGMLYLGACSRTAVPDVVKRWLVIGCKTEGTLCGAFACVRRRTNLQTALGLVAGAMQLWRCAVSRCAVSALSNTSSMHSDLLASASSDSCAQACIFHACATSHLLVDQGNAALVAYSCWRVPENHQLMLHHVVIALISLTASS